MYNNYIILNCLCANYVRLYNYLRLNDTYIKIHFILIDYILMYVSESSCEMQESEYPVEETPGYYIVSCFSASYFFN